MKMVTDEQIGNIITIVEENLDYDRNCHNCEMSKVKNPEFWRMEIIGSG